MHPRQSFSLEARSALVEGRYQGPSYVSPCVSSRPLDGSPAGRSECGSVFGRSTRGGLPALQGCALRSQFKSIHPRWRGLLPITYSTCACMHARCPVHGRARAKAVPCPPSGAGPHAGPARPGGWSPIRPATWRPAAGWRPFSNTPRLRHGLREIPPHLISYQRVIIQSSNSKVMNPRC